MINFESIIKNKKTIISNCDKNRCKEWHILLCFDNNYALPAGVNIFSIIKNNPNKAIHFHLFMQNVSEDNKSKLEQLITTDFISITQYYINNEFKVHSNNTKYFPISACFRIIAPLLLSNYINKDKKLLYVDSDTLCLTSLAPLFDINLDNKFIAAVPDVENTQLTQCPKFNLHHGSYFNSGVMLYNIETWNKFDITERAFDLLNASVKYKFPDQDVLNILLKDNISYLPEKYNCITLLTVGGCEDQKVLDHVVFIHYVSGNKPWFRLYLTPLYQQYIKSSPWQNDKLLLTNNKSPSTTRRHAKLLFSQCKYSQSFFYYILYLKHKIFQK